MPEPFASHPIIWLAMSPLFLALAYTIWKVVYHTYEIFKLNRLLKDLDHFESLKKKKLDN